MSYMICSQERLTGHREEQERRAKASEFAAWRPQLLPEQTLPEQTPLLTGEDTPRYDSAVAQTSGKPWSRTGA